MVYMSLSETPEVVQAADNVYESVRFICHQTIWTPYPAPTVYRLLGDLKLALGPMGAQALEQIASGLVASLAVVEAYEDDGSDPSESAKHAAELIRGAAERLTEVGNALEQAQQAISRQGFRD